MILLAVAMAASATDEPRGAGINFPISEPLIDAQGCIMRKLAHRGNPLPIPAEDGVDIELSEPTILGVANNARYSIHLREVGGARRVSVFYRHPYSVTYAYNLTKGIAKQCFADEFSAVPKP